MRKVFLVFAFLGSALYAAGQDISMHSGTDTLNACSGLFYDPAGPTADYSIGENIILTVYSPSGQMLKAFFTDLVLCVSAVQDAELKIHDGPNITYPVLETFTALNQPPITLYSTGNSLTFHWESGNTTCPGWVAALSCVSMLPPTLISPVLPDTKSPYPHIIGFDWDDVSGATGYVLQYSLDQTFASGVTTDTTTVSHDTIGGFASHSYYHWRVKAFAAVTSSDWSEQGIALTNWDTVQLVTPMNGATFVPDSNIYFDWTDEIAPFPIYDLVIDDFPMTPPMLYSAQYPSVSNATLDLEPNKHYQWVVCQYEYPYLTCSDTFDFYTGPSTGLVQFALNEINLFPTLVSTDKIVYVETFSPNQLAALSITDVNGRLVYQAYGITGAPIKIDALAQGIYFAEIRVGQKRAVRKLVVE